MGHLAGQSGGWRGQFLVGFTKPVTVFGPLPEGNCSVRGSSQHQCHYLLAGSGRFAAR